MADSFDPYRKWLGIPREDQPPHHYRLLGIEPLESDPDVIANAADGRMAQVKNFQAGKYSQFSQKILNELAVAKVCLLNTEKKADYDRELQKHLSAQRKKAPQAVPPSRRRPVADQPTVSITPTPRAGVSSAKSYVSRRGRKRPSWQAPAALATVAVLVLGGLIFALSQQGGSTANEPSDSTGGTSGQADRKASEQATGRQNDVFAGSDPPATDSRGSDSPDDDPLRDMPKDIPPMVRDPNRSLADLLDPNGSNDGGSEAPAANDDSSDDGSSEDGGSADADPVATQKLPVPAEEELAASTKKVRSVFRNELGSARTPAAKGQLAKTLHAKGLETTDAVECYALFDLAAELAAEAHEFELGSQIADSMQQRYDIDGRLMKVSLLERSMRAVRPGSQFPAEVLQIMQAAKQLADETLAAEQFETASRAIKVAETAARRTRDMLVIRQMEKRQREITHLRGKFTPVKKALDILATTPDDPKANGLAGEWYCFYMGDFQKGLPLLAKGDDPNMANVAQRDLQQPTDHLEQLAVGNLWYDLIKRGTDSRQQRARSRAAHWYHQAIGKLSPLDKVKIEKRLLALARSVSPNVGGVIQAGNVALASNGTTTRGVGSKAENLLDGNYTQYTGTTGIAMGRWPCDWIITFDKVYQLREIRFLLYDHQKRYYRYAIEVSTDGTNFTPLVDRSKDQCIGWQLMPFASRPVKAIKLRGLFNSGNEAFHVVEFQAFCLPPPAMRN